MDQAERRATWQGFGEGLTQAVEMAATPVLFALLGLFLDGRFHTRPILTVALAVFAMVGSFLRAYYHYAAQVEELERDKAWRRRGPTREMTPR